MGSIRPDIWVRTGDERYLVEIAVTHFVDEKKSAKIKEFKIPAFEVDLKSLKDNFTFAVLEKVLFNEPYPAKWIFNKHIEDMAAEAVQMHSLAKQRSDELDAQALRESERIRKNDESRRIRKALERSERFRRYREKPPNIKLELNIRQIGINHAQMKKVSTFVPWENSFDVQREVWQSGVLVYIATKEAKRLAEHLPCNIEFQDCLNWMRQAFNVTPQVPNGDSIATWKYLKHLETLGVLTYLWNKEFLLAVSSRNWSQLFPSTSQDTLSLRGR